MEHTIPAQTEASGIYHLNGNRTIILHTPKHLLHILKHIRRIQGPLWHIRKMVRLI